MKIPAKTWVAVLQLMLLVCYSTATKGQGDDLFFEHLSLKDGLSQSTVKCMLQDSKGFMWFGTFNGLNRFDGYQFKVFFHDPGRSNSLSNDLILAILEDNDKNLWIGTSLGLNRLSLGTDNSLGMVPDDFTRFMHDPKEPKSINHNYVSALFLDREGLLWVATPVGLNRFDRRSQSFTRFPFEVSTNKKRRPFSVIVDIFEDSDGRINLLTASDRLYYLDTHLGKIRKKPKGKAPLLQEQIKPSKSWGRIRAIHTGNSGYIWAGTANGLIRHDIKAETTQLFQNNPSVAHTLNSNEVISLYEDNAGTLWVGTVYGGLNKSSKLARRFQHYPNQAPDNDGTKPMSVFSFCEDPGGLIWIGTNSGISIYNPTKKKILDIDYKRSNLSRIQGVVMTMVLDDNRQLWIGSSDSGLFRLDFSGMPEASEHAVWEIELLARVLYDQNKLIAYSNSSSASVLASNRIRELFLDSEQNLWVGSYNRGIGFLPIEGKLPQNYVNAPGNQNSLGDNRIRVISQDHSGVMWIGTEGGLTRFDRTLKQFTRYNKVPLEPSRGLSHNVVTSIYDDESGGLWMGTYGGGLSRFDFATEEFQHFTIADGLPNNIVYGILADDDHLWLSTNKGLSKYDNTKGVFQNYDIGDGLQSYEFNTGSFLKSETSGLFYFGGINGFNVFAPKGMKQNTYKPPVLLTRLEIGSQPHQAVVGIDSTIAKVPYHQNSLTFEFAALDFTNPSKNRYAYKLEGLEDEWIYSGNRRYASYSNLRPGDYTIRVKGTNSDGMWNEAASDFRFTILPPWWQTWWLRCLLVATMATLIFGAHKIRLKRVEEQKLKLQSLVARKTRDLEIQKEELREQKELAEASRVTIKRQADKLRDLDKMKSRFYANISHEFRTPLTLILNPLEDVLASSRKDEPMQKTFLTMRKNGSKLLRLINQLLDLAKLESGKLTLKPVGADLSAFAKELATSFAPLAEYKKVRFDFAIDEGLHFKFDPDKLEKVIVNLLSNAFKFTEPGGIVDFQLRKRLTVGAASKVIEIIVKDDGKGIADEYLDRIFDRFFQIEAVTVDSGLGTGIGLALAKELVELQGGTITVQSQLNVGTEFLVEIPLIPVSSGTSTVENIKSNGNGYFHEHPFSNMKEDSPASSPVDSGTVPKMLIAEDNPDVLEYVQNRFKATYEVATASEGSEALDIAKKLIPDIIISDVMMPKLDGFQLCQRLKTEVATSHIPVILLTARASIDSKLTGLKTGADDYLAKPFDLKELQARVQNLITQRRILRERFKRELVVQPGEVTVTSMDESFLNKTIKTIEENMDDPEFAADSLRKELNMSLQQLHRKLQALTGLPPGKLIRSFRLKRANQLLQYGAGNVSEVAFKVGFNHLSYFSKCFRQQFGYNPSEVEKKL